MIFELEIFVKVTRTGCYVRIYEIGLLTEQEAGFDRSVYIFLLESLYLGTEVLDRKSDEFRSELFSLIFATFIT